MKRTLGLFAVAATGMVLSDVRSAEACGGCFVPSSEVTVVTDHRMALSVSPQQTVLWDQIRYSGDPREFAWVLPVRAGTKIEVANDEFFTALDVTSQPIVYGPQRFGGAAGCGLTGCADSDNAASSESGPGGGVQVISQSVVGPYEQVTLRATDDDALTAWLRKNEFSIPTTIEPTIEAYVREGFDFIALKLRPECGERSMRPVRVVSPGADATLPLRMVAAGVGPKVGIILYVITEGKYRPQNFPSVLINDADLRWDRFANKSNYEELSQSIMAREDGRTWITEYADKPQIPLTGSGWQPPSSATSSGGVVARNPRFADTYFGLCKTWRAYNPQSPQFGSSSSSSSGSTGTLPAPCTSSSSQNPFPPPRDAGADVSQQQPSNDGGAGQIDAGEDDDAGTGDAGSNGNGDEDQFDSGTSSKPSQPTGSPSIDCQYLDDLDVALDGLHRENVWVTRLRSVLPSNALATDLRLEPSLLPDGRADVDPVSSLHWTPYYADEDSPSSSDKASCVGAPKQHRTYGSWVLAVVSAIFGVAWLRRRRRE